MTEASPANLANEIWQVADLKAQDEVKAEHEDRGMRGRFGAGLPPINDGSLADVIARAQSASQALELRGVRAAALFLGGDYRRALPEFESLALAHERVSGPTGEQTLECRQQAAYCRVELGDITEALAELRAVLVGYRGRGEERDPVILEMRRTIVRLQIALGQRDQAADVLPALYQDVTEVLGPDDPLSREIRDMHTRLDPSSDRA